MICYFNVNATLGFFQMSVNTVTPIEPGKPEEPTPGPSTWNVEIFVQSVKEMVSWNFLINIFNNSFSTGLHCITLMLYQISLPIICLDVIMTSS